MLNMIFPHKQINPDCLGNRHAQRNRFISQNLLTVACSQARKVFRPFRHLEFCQYLTVFNRALLVSIVKADWLVLFIAIKEDCEGKGIIFLKMSTLFQSYAIYI